MFIVVDDLSTAVDLPAVQTPRIDELAAWGVRFQRAYASHPLCTPSRLSMLAGQLVHHTEAESNDYAGPPDGINGVAYLPCRLRDAGYHVSAAGKVFHHDHPECWDFWVENKDDEWISQPTLPKTPEYADMVWGGPFLNGIDGSLGDMADTKNTLAAIDKIIEGKANFDATGQPFAVFLGLVATHNLFIYPESFLSMYGPQDVPPLPPGESTLPWQTAVNWQAWFTPLYYNPVWGATEEAARIEALQAYFRCIAYVDSEVGRVIDRIKELELEGDTVVVLVGDHGLSFSEHGHVGKTTGFEADIRTPLIVVSPANPSTHGDVVDTPVSLVDLYPTIMELLGLVSPAALDGASLVPLLEHPGALHPPAFYTTDEESGFNLVRHVVKRDVATGLIWKLAHWENDATIPPVHELYELTQDPDEYENLYGAPGMDAKVAELRQELQDVGLLGPLVRNFAAGWKGPDGTPALDWVGVPLLGSAGSLHIGNLTGAPTLCLVNLGLDGVYSGPPNGAAVAATWPLLLSLPAGDLFLAAHLPDDPLLDGTPVGLQVFEPFAGVEGGFLASRGLSILLSL